MLVLGTQSTCFLSCFTINIMVLFSTSINNGSNSRSLKLYGHVAIIYPHTSQYGKSQHFTHHTYIYTCIPWIQKFAHMAVGYAIIHEHTKYTKQVKYTESIQYKYYTDCIYGIIDHSEHKLINRVNGLYIYIFLMLL